MERSGRDVQTVLFTAVYDSNEIPDTEETELALEMMERAIYTSLRRADISTRYSGKQIIAILMDANPESPFPLFQAFCKK